MIDKVQTHDRAAEAPKLDHSHVLPRELHSPSNFKFKSTAGNGEKFVPPLSLHNGHHDRHAENSANGKVTDLSGQACKIQPKGKQFATLENATDNGCHYRDPADPHKTENEDLAALVKKGKESTVEIQFKDKQGGGGSGSGVVIGSSEDGRKVYVATDNHVASPEVNPGGSPATARRIMMPDGKFYPAKLELTDPKTDRAVLSVDVGPGNAQKYKAAEFAQNADERGKGVILGFPKDSQSIYASPANLNGLKHADEMFGGPGGTLKGEKPNRKETDMPRTRTEEGVSGGPIFDSSGKVAGLLEGGMKVNPMTGKKEYWSYGNPTTKNDVENWLAKIKERDSQKK